MTAKTKEYLQAAINIVILVLLIFYFNLPKNIIVNIVITVIVFIVYNELFPDKKKISRKREYITTLLIYSVFFIIIFIFDLPKKIYLFITLLAISSIVLSELFNLIKEKEE